MSYRVLVPKPVRKQLDALPPAVRRRILDKILELQNDPRPPGCVKLRAHQREHRIRIGDYRVRYEIDDTESKVLLLHCKDRKDVYRS